MNLGDAWNPYSTTPELKGKRFDIVLDVSDDETSEGEDDSTATRRAVAPAT
jgi:hypothetical protein